MGRLARYRALGAFWALSAPAGDDSEAREGAGDQHHGLLEHQQHRHTAGALTGPRQPASRLARSWEGPETILRPEKSPVTVTTACCNTTEAMDSSCSIATMLGHSLGLASPLSASAGAGKPPRRFW